MKLYRLFLLIVLFYSPLLFAQSPFSVKKIIALEEINSGYRPVFVHSKSIVYTDAANNGLYLYDFKSKKSTKLCDDTGAGNHFKVSEDGKTVVYKSYVIDHFGRRQSSVYKIDITKNKKTELIKNVRELSSLDYQDGNLFFIHQKSLKKYFFKNKKIKSKQLHAFSDADLNLIVYENGVKKVLNPFGKGNYIWVSLSPDKQKVLFTKTGKGTFVCDVDGNIIAHLGRLHAPKWSDDGKWIIGMNDFDDGYKYTNSQIIMISSDGKDRQVFNLKDIKIALYPDLSKNNSKIVFNTESGKIYVLSLKYR